jgi:hypothetical protein
MMLDLHAIMKIGFGIKNETNFLVIRNSRGKNENGKVAGPSSLEGRANRYLIFDTPYIIPR